MNLTDWTKSEDGRAEVFPLVAYETLVTHGTLCVLKVHYLLSPNQMLEGEASSVPLALTPEMARSLAGALLKCAEEAVNGPSEGTPN